MRRSPSSFPIGIRTATRPSSQPGWVFGYSRPSHEHVPGGPPADSLAIEAIDLVRTYRTHLGVIRRRSIEVEAVRGISFNVRNGELFGLLGPNGAGKTTTIKMLVTLLLPTSGSARVMGYDVVRDTTEVRKRIGYVFGGERGLYDRISGLDNLRFFAELYGVEPAAQRPRIDALLDLVGLAGRENEKVEGYSRGMRQRLHIARGLLHDPPVLFLDEPSSASTRSVPASCARRSRTWWQAGKTILLTTHYMFEADALCERIAVINGGKIVATGTGSDLKAVIANRTIVEIETYGVTAEAVDRLRADPDVIAVNTEDQDQSQILLVQSERGTEITQRLIQQLGDTRIGRSPPASPPSKTPTFTSSPAPAARTGRAPLGRRRWPDRCPRSPPSGPTSTRWPASGHSDADISDQRFLHPDRRRSAGHLRHHRVLPVPGRRRGRGRADAPVRGPGDRDDGRVVHDPVRRRRRHRLAALGVHPRAAGRRAAPL